MFCSDCWLSMQHLQVSNQCTHALGHAYALVRIANLLTANKAAYIKIQVVVIHRAWLDKFFKQVNTDGIPHYICTEVLTLYFKLEQPEKWTTLDLTIC